MSIRLTSLAALSFSAAFAFSSASVAQAPIVDASVPAGASNNAPANQQYGTEPRMDVAPPPLNTVNNSAAQGELFNQLQLLQQEVMQLRGIVEEQTHNLQQLKDQNMERYIDLDRRLGELSTAGPVGETAAPGQAASPAKPQPSAPVKAMSGEQEAYDAAYLLVRNRRFDDSLDAFKQLLIDYPDGKYTPNSYYWVGELYQVITPQKLEAARQAFSQLLERYPDHAKVPDAMYKLGKVHFLKGDRSKSRDYLEQVIAKYGKGSNSSTADKARQFLNTNF
jgi:tol-pal system protein YbgF